MAVADNSSRYGTSGLTNKRDRGTERNRAMNRTEQIKHRIMITSGEGGACTNGHAASQRVSLLGSTLVVCKCMHPSDLIIRI